MQIASCTAHYLGGCRLARQASLPAAEKGVVIIEFILVLPILLVMLGYTLRLTQLLQAHQIAMTLSREAATEAFRRCIDITILSDTCSESQEMCINVPLTTQAIESCLDQLKNKYQALWPIARPSGNSDNAVVDLAIYRYDLESFSLPANCTAAPPRTTAFITSNELATLPISNESLCRRNRVARARISFSLSPTGAFLNLIPGFANSSFDIVDETVL